MMGWVCFLARNGATTDVKMIENRTMRTTRLVNTSEPGKNTELGSYLVTNWLRTRLPAPCMKKYRV